MKNEILEVSDKLRLNQIDEDKAKQFLLFLFGVIPRYSIRKYPTSRYRYNYYILDNKTDCIEKNYVDYADGQIIKDCVDMNNAV